MGLIKLKLERKIKTVGLKLERELKAEPREEQFLVNRKDEKIVMKTEDSVSMFWERKGRLCRYKVDRFVTRTPYKDERIERVKR